MLRVGLRVRERQRSVQMGRETDRSTLLELLRTVESASAFQSTHATAKVCFVSFRVPIFVSKNNT